MALKETIRMYVGLPGILAKARETFNFTHTYPDGTSKTYTFPQGKHMSTISRNKDCKSYDCAFFD